MFYLVLYDISDDKRRTKLAKTLEDFGETGLQSSVRIYCLCANCEREIRVIGKGEVSKNEDVYII